MPVVIHIVESVLLLSALLHFATILIVGLRARCEAAAAGRPATETPAVTILRPVCGIENGLVETLGSAFTLDYPRYEIVFCVASGRDPVVAIVERLMADHPDVPARLLAGDDRISINPKLNNLVKGWEAARHDWIVMADSNVLMPPDYLQRLLARWWAGTGLVCSPPVGVAPGGFWSELECGFLNTYQARWQLAADAIGFGFAQGKTMLWRRDILEAAGGIRALAAEAAEDAAATKLVRARGERVRLVFRPFPQPLGRRGFMEVWRRQLRWARLRRVSFKLFFVPELLAGSLIPFGAAAYLVAIGALPAAGFGALAVAWYAAEALLAHVMRWPLSLRSPPAWLMRDLILPFLWLAAMSGSGFVWRDNAMNVRRATLAGELQVAKD